MIRAAQEGDCAAIGAIWNPLIRDSAITFTSQEKRPEEIAALLASRAEAGDPVLVAEVAGQVAGFGYYVQFRSGPGYARSLEHSVHLAPSARGRGLGRALVAALADRARARQAHWLIGGVSGENPGGLAFHRALGFAPLAVLPEVGFKFGRYIDLHLLGLRL